MIALLALTGCDAAPTAMFCDASGIRVNGQPLGELAIADGTAPAGCQVFAAPEILNVTWFTASEKFAFNVQRRSGVQQLRPGAGSVLVKWNGLDCTAYGTGTLESDLPDWRVSLDVRCEDGTTVSGEAFGHYDAQ